MNTRTATRLGGNLIFAIGLFLFLQESKFAVIVCLLGFGLVLFGWLGLRPRKKS